MKLVVAVIRPFKLRSVLNALNEVGVEQLWHGEARGYGRQKDHLQDYKDDRFAIAFLPRVRVEFVVLREKLSRAIDAVCAAARTGRQGDGKIWVLEASAVQLDAVRP